VNDPPAIGADTAAPTPAESHGCAAAHLLCSLATILSALLCGLVCFRRTDTATGSPTRRRRPTPIFPVLNRGSQSLRPGLPRPARRRKGEQLFVSGVPPVGRDLRSSASAHSRSADWLACFHRAEHPPDRRPGTRLDRPLALILREGYRSPFASQPRLAITTAAQPLSISPHANSGSITQSLQPGRPEQGQAGEIGGLGPGNAC